MTDSAPPRSSLLPASSDFPIESDFRLRDGDLVVFKRRDEAERAPATAAAGGPGSSAVPRATAPAEAGLRIFTPEEQVAREAARRAAQVEAAAEAAERAEALEACIASAARAAD